MDSGIWKEQRSKQGMPNEMGQVNSNQCMHAVADAGTIQGLIIQIHLGTGGTATYRE